MFINKHTMRLNNERSVIRHVINYGPISRSKIARDLSINKVTISSILEELLEKQYVVEIGEGHSTKNGGRKPQLIEFNKNFGFFINIEIGKEYLNIMATYANGQVNRFEEISMANLTNEKIQLLLKKKINNFSIKDTVHELLGISIAVHKKVFDNKYVSAISDNTDLVTYLKDEYKVPVIILNNANAAAIFQRDFSSNNEIKNLISITINETISAGVIIDENLYLGNKDAAGSIENMQFLIQTDEGVKAFNPIDYCSQEAILREVAKYDGLNNLTLQQVAKLYVKGNKEVVAAITRFVDSIVLVLNNIIASYSPQIIYLDSTLIENLPMLLIQIKSKLPILEATQTQLQIARQTKFAPLLGGYSLLVRKIFDLGAKRLRLIP